MSPRDPAVFEQIGDDVRRMMAEWAVPGVAVSIAGEDGLIWAEGFGTRSVSAGTAVDADTLFAIGSCTKAFTTAAIALEVERGRLRWDAPVRSVLPDFALADPLATEHISLRDMAMHRSGLPRHDMVWYNATVSQDEIVRRLRYLQPSALFRSEFQYSNLMYMAAGRALEVATGRSWSDAVSDGIFAPLGMARSRTSALGIESVANHADPHSPGPDREPQPVALYASRDPRPSGSIYASARDLAAWLSAWIRMADGGAGFLSGAQAREVLAPQILYRSEVAAPGTHVDAYGLGWSVASYRGYLRVSHGGGVRGFISGVSFLPEERLAVAIVTNGDGHSLPGALGNAVYDRLLGLDAVDWTARFQAASEHAFRMAQAPLPPPPAQPAPARPAADYVGAYVHPAYGDLTVDEGSDGGLVATFHGLSLEFVHFDGDRFRASGAVVDTPVEFRVGASGRVEAVAVRLEPHPAVDAIAFARVP